MNFTTEQIKALAPKEAAFKAGQKLASGSWVESHKSNRAIWGAIKGSGKNPYLVQVDIKNLAYKCSCPSRQFPCKHALGLLLLYVNTPTVFTETAEPDYVLEWLEKREARSQKSEKEERELTEDEKQKRFEAKEKRQDDRMKLVNAGLAELKVWLKDLIQLGILELPNRKPAYFETMIKRMVDAKMPGLAGWIRALKELNYKNQNTWQEDALSIISKLYLLVRSGEKLNELDENEKLNIQSLLGWTFNQKDMLQDKNLVSQKDQWLVLGETKEEQDDLKIQRFWLFGLESKRDAIIIHFESQYSNASIQFPIVKGSVIEAELVFYPATSPHRAFIKKQKEIFQKLPKPLELLPSWESYRQLKIQELKLNPWSNNRSNIIAQVKVIKEGNNLIVVDKDTAFKTIDKSFFGDSRSSLLMLTNNEEVNLSFVDMPNGIFPLGILHDNQYISF
ncbi:MAG: SWIM zinc finger domain-containing protein [Aestuariibaculum sp.]